MLSIDFIFIHNISKRVNSKIDDVWVIFYLGEIVTIRNKDWEKIEGYFAIPEPIKEIEYQRIKLDRVACCHLCFKKSI